MKRVETTQGQVTAFYKREVKSRINKTGRYFKSSIGARVAFKLVDEAMRNNKVNDFACAKGCAYCCYIQTDITAGESFILARAVREMPKDQREKVLTRLEANAEAFSSMSLTERQKAKIPCALLDLEKQTCSVYGDRPTVCRKWHSVDVSACESEFRVPGSAGTPIDATAMQAGMLVILGYWEAMNHEPNGELHQGVLLAMHPDAEKAFANGEPVFKGWQASDSNATPEEVEKMQRDAMGLRDANELPRN
jgi:Fe-S-cluster containining protein